ncbi:hypothetical protein [Aeromonas sp. s8]|uniref:hypothetical protein n=1 Tax=Aeromonas sp. s8 TaxID=3138489 RepID=UPI0034A55EE3
MASGSSTKPHSHHVQKETAKAVSFFICLPQLLAPNPPPRLLIYCFLQVASSPACWRGFFMSDASLLMVVVKKINGVKAPYGTFLVHKRVVGNKFLMKKLLF